MKPGLGRRWAPFRQSATTIWLWLQYLLHITGCGSTASTARLERWQFLPFDDGADIIRIDGLAFEQSRGHAVHDVLVVVEDAVGCAICFIYEVAHFSID